MAREQHVAKLQARQSEIPRKVAVRLVRGEGRGVSDLYGVRDAACPLSTRGGRGGNTRTALLYTHAARVPLLLSPAVRARRSCLSESPDARPSPRDLFVTIASAKVCYFTSRCFTLLSSEGE